MFYVILYLSYLLSIWRMMTEQNNPSEKLENKNSSIETPSSLDLDQALGNQKKTPQFRQERTGKIPITVWQIGMVMLLMNISYIMIYSFSGLYLKHVIGASFIGIGFLESICESISSVMKLTSGILSDFFKKRKKIMVIGYAFAVIGRIIFAVSSTFLFVFSARALERFGNGVLASPRDAIVADVAPRKKIGASYGLKRSLAYIGSLLGGIIGFFAMKWTNNDYQSVFSIAIIPATIAFIILMIFIKEPKRFDHPALTSETPMPTPKLKPKFALRNFKYLGKYFWVLMIVNTIYMTGRMGETFLTLRMKEGFQPDPMFAAIVMLVFNIGTASSSYPVGYLGDRLNRIKILFLGLAFLVLSDITMYSASTQSIMYLGIFFWGIQYGAIQNVFVSLIAEKVPEDLRGTGFGVFWLLNAFAAFVADNLAGCVAEHFSLNHVFVSSGIIGLIALLVLAMVIHTISPTTSGRNAQ